MQKPKYNLTFLPSFATDLEEAAQYIAKILQNPQAAERLLQETQTAILKRLESPLSFEPYHSARPRKHTYYRINIRNFSVFYVVIGDTMEVRRFLYAKRDVEQIL